MTEVQKDPIMEALARIERAVGGDCRAISSAPHNITATEAGSTIPARFDRIEKTLARIAERVDSAVPCP